ncbi:hypothetical protein EUGRSUZ_D00383 [Eucalyptus grandis]|uniref:Uncharacterized protein n=2 Tax=Eucalyptus grandis TaxID=71139 RepID=A0ACC3L3E2_EUCGR|nr:hypothetical protein EUGRSUZ_D00383 [Eucalyptus grandis]
MIRLERIEALLAITAAILVFLGVFGSFRRRCVNRAFTLVAFAAYYLSPAIIAYTLGLIQSAPFCSSHFPIWTAYLVVVLGSADSYTAHSIEDIEQWKSFNVDSAAKCFMTNWMIASYATPSVPIFCTGFLFIILFVKADERARALMSASKSVMRKKYKSIADYMSTEHDLSGDCDPTEMRGYKYIVRGAEETKRITVDEVWCCPERLLKEADLDGRLKDLCLSFSLFKFICLRYAGYSLPQKAHEKLWRLIQHMLSEQNGYKRVFRVIEVELTFLFDLFYTKYSVNLNPRRSVLLPDHPCRTESIFDQAVSEASNLFGGSSVSMGNRIEKLEKNIDDKTIIGQGAKLGRELKGTAHNKQIWKGLANFWTEMVLYVAPSNDAKAHAKYLATGGEFLTHVWVLVSHAGITRDPLGGDDPERS